MFIPPPGSPPAFETVMLRLGTNPCKACCALATGRDSISFAVTVEIAPVKSTFFLVPYPITTTSPMSPVLVREMFMFDSLAATAISCD